MLQYIAGLKYNPADYVDLEVSDSLRKLIPLITEFEPEEIELAAPLKPFIPEFVPARGGIDDFIKVRADIIFPAMHGLETSGIHGMSNRDRCIMDKLALMVQIFENENSQTVSLLGVDILLQYLNAPRQP